MWSPEHLLVSAVATCFTTTFFATAEHAGLRLGEYRCHGTGILDRAPGAIVFTAIELVVQLAVRDDDAERARTLVNEAKRRCFVANTLRCPVRISVETRAP